MRDEWNSLQNNENGHKESQAERVIIGADEVLYFFYTMYTSKIFENHLQIVCCKLIHNIIYMYNPQCH